MINCSEFLARYSEFRDHFLEVELHDAFVRHVELCDSCARYDRVVSGGIDTLLRLPELTPSEDFTDRLDLRIAGESYLEGRSVSGAPVALVFAVAVAIGAAAWLPVLREDAQAMRLPAAVAHAPYHPQVLPLVFHPAVLPNYTAGQPPRPASYGGSADFSPYSLLGTPSQPAQPRVAQAGR